MMDFALAIEQLVPGAEYFGVPDSEDAYKALDWKDKRKKPTLTQIKAVELPAAPLADRLKEIIAATPDEVLSDPQYVAFIGGADLLLKQGRHEAVAAALEKLPTENGTAAHDAKQTALAEIKKEAKKS